MKKVMKLVVVGALCAITAFVLAACGGSSSSTSSDSSAAAGGKYTIATDTAFAPFEYANSSGQYEGIDIDLLEAIAKDQGFEYELNPLGFDAALQAVQADQADGVIAGMSITDERKKVFDFSDAYYDSTVCCAVSDSKYTKLEDLKGEKVAVKKGTQSEAWANSIAQDYGFTCVEFDTSDIMYQDVSAGNSAACFEDTPVMGYAISTGNVKLQIIEEVDGSSEFATPYGFAVNKGKNAELMEKFNAGLKNIKDNGTYDEIVAKYVKSK